MGSSFFRGVKFHEWSTSAKFAEFTYLEKNQLYGTTVIRLPHAHRKVSSLGVRYDYNIHVHSTYIYNIDIIPIPCIPRLFASFDVILIFLQFLVAKYQFVIYTSAPHKLSTLQERQPLWHPSRLFAPSSLSFSLSSILCLPSRSHR